MSTVLLINANRSGNPHAVFPLGLAYLHSALEQAGHRVHTYDPCSSEIDLEQAVTKRRHDIIGVSIRNIDDCHFENTRFLVEQDIALVRRVRALSDATVVLGGSGFSMFPERVLKESGAPFGIVGEGERSFPELIERLLAGKPVDAVPGLVYLSGEEMRINANPGHPFPSLVPFRDRQLTEYYLRESSMLNLQTQRGCNFRCCYCSYPVLEGRSFRRRDPGDVVGELREMHRLGGRYFFIVDSVFNTSSEHVAGICEAIIRSNVRLEWGCFLRPKGLTAELVNLMKRAGLKHVEFGTDSLSDRVLAAYGKGFTFQDVKDSSDLLHRHSINYAHFLIIGGPGESESTLRESYRNSRKLSRTVMFPFVGMRVFPQTPLFEMAVAQGIIDREADLFNPLFYISPEISPREIYRLLEEYRKESPNWVVGEPDPKVLEIMKKLRQKGVTGPMWEYLSR